MKIKTKNKTYIIKKAASIYTNRNNANIKLDDVSIYESGYNYGVTFNNEIEKFVTIVKFASENAEVLRDYKQLPKEITVDLLKQWGFIKKRVTDVSVL